MSCDCHVTATARQVELVEQLVAVAAAVKVTRDAHRQTVLVKELQRVGERFVSDFRLPLSPALLVQGLDIEVGNSTSVHVHVRDSVCV